jgi:RES domain-containing protein
MLVYRIGKTKHAADLSGEGAKINGGRWNHKTVPCVYTSESRALSLLEYTVNVNIENIPRALSVTTIEIPDNEILIVSEDELPGNWKSVPVPSSTQDFGTVLLKTSKKQIIKIPSSIIAEEFNFILNPFEASNGFRIIEIKDLIYDVRIKNV